MATLKSVPVRLPADKVPTKRMVRDIIGTFLTQEWPSVNLESLQMSHRVNFANAHCPVERPNTTNDASIEPLRVFIKFHEKPEIDIEIFKHLAPRKDQEALLCHDFGQSESGHGAKVHGFFQTEDGTLGRVDEFLDARNMEPEDVEDGAIRADIAKAMANFSAMESSVPGTPVAAYYDAMVPGLQKYHKLEKLKALGKEGGVSMDSLVDYDFASRVRIVVDAMEAIKAKAGWCIHDVQFMNTMVKNHPQPYESKVALIDFELVMRNYRGFDIGGHFMQKMFKWFDEKSKIADCRKYSDVEKRHFCDEYAKEWNRVTGDADTGEQVLREAEYGYMLAITFDIHNMLWYMAKEDDKDPLNLEALNKLYDEFSGQYRKLGLESQVN
ncbi:hypothetical protein SCUP515_05677 [Seiridium cupressi]